MDIVLITATPYFLSRIPDEDPLKGSFSSYVSISYTATGLVSLGFATASAARADNTKRIRTASMALIVCHSLLAVSPILPFTGRGFFGFVLVNSIALAIGVSYLQTSITAVTALFGPSMLAVMFQGQAVVGVVVSAVQYISTAASYRPSLSKKSRLVEEPSTQASGSPTFAFIFFGLAASFLAFSLLAHSRLLAMPAYVAVVDRRSSVLDDDDLEDEPSLAESAPFLVRTPEAGAVKVLDVAKMNGLFNFSIASVFSVTLVSSPRL